jgi:hypothetical protein
MGDEERAREIVLVAMGGDERTNNYQEGDTGGDGW